MFLNDHEVFASSYDKDKGTVYNEHEIIEKPYRTLTFNDFLQSNMVQLTKSYRNVKLCCSLPLKEDDFDKFSKDK